MSLTAKQIAQHNKRIHRPDSESEDLEFATYEFTPQQFELLWNQICKEQRKLCVNRYIEHLGGAPSPLEVAAIRNAPRPERE